ncbi:MAG TPA: hypothetical protein VHK01_20405 [Lacipirellulaceae bacterium]|jgi:hypothetical protein|nr:hypothetical protein [Lacipirellulaceae bacterium]
MAKDSTGIRSNRRPRQASVTPWILAALLIAGTTMLTGCAATNMADHLPTVAGGLPESAPARPASPAAYPPVHDMPPARENTVLTSDEQKKLEDELIAARKRAAGAGGASGKSAAGPATRDKTPR